MFPKFSTKARGSKASEVTPPPPHTIKAHGRYDLHIGPHVFLNTAIYEVHYHPSVDPSSGFGAQPTTSISPTHTAGPSQPQSAVPAATFPSISYVTPALSSRVAAASQSDPILANLLKAVINRTATEDQIKTLGLLIKSLEGVQQLGATMTNPSPNPLPPLHLRAGSPKPFDIIIEFHERPSDRWIFPRGDIFCERPGVPLDVYTRSSDVIITTSLPFPDTVAAVDSSTIEVEPLGVSPEVASFRFSRVPSQLWDLFVIWAGGPDKMAESRAKLIEVVQNAAPPSYLKYRLPDGELLSEIQKAVAPPYTTKPIKPAGADSNRAKRKSMSRKATSVSNSPSSLREKAALAKRRQQLKANTPTPLPISCRSCGQTDVPLMMGGRYCRTCIDEGRTVAEIPQLPPRNETSAHSIHSVAPHDHAVRSSSNTGSDPIITPSPAFTEMNTVAPNS